MTSPIKANGIHYTPPELAGFLASAMIEHLPERQGAIRVLDPACGDGGLLEAFVKALPVPARKQLVLTGYDTDPEAIQKARERLSDMPIRRLTLDVRDFLISDAEAETVGFDAVISNPPYVRTQVLGAQKAQMLARRFGLTGRVDLYQAFTKAIAAVLKPGGVLGLLTSNRFLTVKAGQAQRRLLRTDFVLRSIYDLGDTKLFAAAVLPVIVVANKRSEGSTESPCRFDRVYESRGPRNPSSATTFFSALTILSHSRIEGTITTPEGTFFVERGALSPVSDPGEVFSLTNPAYRGWLKTVRAREACRFGDIARIRVGIKTTADAVFVRDDWCELPQELQPEAELLFPLLTHREARRWQAIETGEAKRVLYPHRVSNQGKRIPISLEEFPKAAAYLRSNEARLKGRKYVTDSGRKWYEIWVPHQPADWAKPKIVCPDISENPLFFLDESGAIVQGDCYWMTLREGIDPDWLLLLLAVANSTFIAKYYDIVFHNQLYAGRRRFMTQYVASFPLPELGSKIGQDIVAAARQLVRSPHETATEIRIDELVWKSFGVKE